LQRLLILGCSERKLRLPESPIPALLRYDGPFFRVLKRTLNLNYLELEIYILSARFGLIAAEHRIPMYDERLNSRRKNDILPKVTASVEALVQVTKSSSALICMGRQYLELLHPSLPLIAAALPVTITPGGMGEKLTRLSEWLAGDATRVPSLPGREGEPKIKGRRLTCSLAEALSVANNAVEARNQKALECHGWYIPVNSARVSPKWLVHAISGLSVAEFHTDDARRVLSAIGIECLRV
jgi:hypothetical protein